MTEMSSNARSPARTSSINGHEQRAACVAAPCDPRAIRDYLDGRDQRPTTVVRVERGLLAIGRSDLVRSSRHAGPAPAGEKFRAAVNVVGTVFEVNSRLRTCQIERADDRSTVLVKFGTSHRETVTSAHHKGTPVYVDGVGVFDNDALVKIEELTYLDTVRERLPVLEGGWTLTSGDDVEESGR